MSFTNICTNSNVLAITPDVLAIDAKVAEAKARELCDTATTELLEFWAESSGDWKLDEGRYYASASSNPVAKSLFSAIALSILRH